MGDEKKFLKKIQGDYIYDKGKISNYSTQEDKDFTNPPPTKGKKRKEKKTL